MFIYLYLIVNYYEYEVNIPNLFHRFKFYSVDFMFY